MDPDQHVEPSYSGSIAEPSIYPHWSSSSSSTLNAMEAHGGSRKGFSEDAELEEYDVANPLKNPRCSLWLEDRVVGTMDGEGKAGQSYRWAWGRTLELGH